MVGRRALLAGVQAMSTSVSVVTGVPHGFELRGNMPRWDLLKTCSKAIADAQLCYR